jgi:hypothetical protein
MVNLMHVTAALNHKVLKETAKRQSVAKEGTWRPKKKVK